MKTLIALLKRIWEALTHKESKFEKWCSQYEEEHGL